MVYGDDDGVDKSILPGLPDDLALRCLAKISHGYHGVLECVSKSWRDAIRSTYYAHLKASEGWCGNWLFVSTSEQNTVMWDAYDPDADKWHTLPRMPRFRNDVCRSRFSVVSLHKKLLVIGGCYVTSNSPLATNEVIIFDPFKKQWSRLANMRTPRADFACTVICGLVYVAGGWGFNTCDTGLGLSAAEVYDPITDRWEDLPPMPVPLFECFSVSHGGEFHVVGKKGLNVEPDTYIIYDPVGKEWRTVDELVLFSKLSRCTVTTMNDRLYAIPDVSVLTLETTQRDWSLLGVLPSVVPPLHTGPFCFGIAGLEQYLYVAGGWSTIFDSNVSLYRIMKLNCCRRCNPAKSPLQWQDVKPMPRQSGTVRGCCAIEE